MDFESEIIVTSNQIEEGSPAEFLSRVRGISTSLRRLRNNAESADSNIAVERAGIVLDELNATLISPNHQEFSLVLQRADAEDTTTIFYAGSSLFVQRLKDEEPEQMKPDAEGFGVVQFVNTVIDDLYKTTHPDETIIW